LSAKSSLVRRSFGSAKIGSDRARRLFKENVKKEGPPQEEEVSSQPEAQEIEEIS
jgi:hypothetical protein